MDSNTEQGIKQSFFVPILLLLFFRCYVSWTDRAHRLAAYIVEDYWVEESVELHQKQVLRSRCNQFAVYHG